MQKELEFISSSSRVGISCLSAGGVLLGTEISSADPLALTELARDHDGFTFLGDKAGIKLGSQSWYALHARGRLQPGSEFNLVNTGGGVLTNQIDLKTSSFPGVLAEAGEKPVVIIAMPKNMRRWDADGHDNELARLALRRLVSPEKGFELQHMLTMVLKSLLTGEGRDIPLLENAHNTHHGKQEAQSAIARNFLRGSAKVGLLTIDASQEGARWLVFNHNGDELVINNVRDGITAEEEQQVLSNGLAVAVHHILQAGIAQDNPDIKPGKVASMLIDSSLQLAETNDSTAGDISDRLITKLRSTRKN